MQPTPLRVDEIAAILRARISYNAISIYRCGAADGQSVGPLTHAALQKSHILWNVCEQLPGKALLCYERREKQTIVGAVAVIRQAEHKRLYTQPYAIRNRLFIASLYSG